MVTTAETNAFLTWFSSWGQVIYVLAQVLFWGGLAVAALIIAMQYRRFVSYKIQRSTLGGERPLTAEVLPPVAVEEFVD